MQPSAEPAAAPAPAHAPAPAPIPGPASAPPLAVAADAEDFGFILAHALASRQAGLGPLTGLLGLSGAQLAAFLTRLRPEDVWPAKAWPAEIWADTALPAPAKSAEQSAIETLILWRAGVAGEEVRWLAAILARRAQESRHLWEDLGLPSRPALGEMIARRLPGLAAANSRQMRWKKFFYRQICADAAFSLCLAPSCDECCEKAACFAPG